MSKQNQQQTIENCLRNEKRILLPLPKNKHHPKGGVYFLGGRTLIVARAIVSTSGNLPLDIFRGWNKIKFVRRQRKNYKTERKNTPSVITTIYNEAKVADINIGEDRVPESVMRLVGGMTKVLYQVSYGWTCDK